MREEFNGFFFSFFFGYLQTEMGIAVFGVWREDETLFVLGFVMLLKYVWEHRNCFMRESLCPRKTAEG